MKKSLERHRRDWDDLAELDPFWSILVDKERKHGGWNPEEFFGTGKVRVSQLRLQLDELGLPRERGLALDFGCGLGRLSEPLVQLFTQCIGVDISARMVKLARWYHRYEPRVSFEVLDRQDLSRFGDQKFDFILSLLVLQHQPSARVVEFWLHELIRILKPGGLLMFQLPHRIGFRSHWQVRRRAYRLLCGLGFNKRSLYYMGLHPVRMLALSESRARRVLEKAGGKICKVLEDGSAGPHNGSLLYLVTR